MKKRKVLIFCDNTSADNLAMLDAATRGSSPLDVQLVVISGRAAHSDRAASKEERDEEYSSHIHELNTMRAKGYLKRAGRPIPVFQGEEVYRTALRTTIPHEVHADEHGYDTMEDWGNNTRIDGDFMAALATLRRIIATLEPDEKLMVLVGGPCTELAIILRYCPDIAARLGTIVMQAGDFAKDESSNLRGGKGNSFNGAVDAAALHDVLFMHQGDVFILPSNITKQRELALTIDEIERYARPELTAIYRIHAVKRGGQTYIHDLGVVIFAEQILEGNKEHPYRYNPVTILEVPYGAPVAGQSERRGTIVIGPAEVSQRHVVTWQDTASYHERLAEYLRP